MAGERLRAQRQEQSSQRFDQRHAHSIFGDDKSSDGFAGFTAGGQGLGQQIRQIKDLHAPIAHVGDKRIVLFLGVLHPQHIVKK